MSIFVFPDLNGQPGVSEYAVRRAGFFFFVRVKIEQDIKFAVRSVM